MDEFLETTVEWTSEAERISDNTYISIIQLYAEHQASSADPSHHHYAFITTIGRTETLYSIALRGSSIAVQPEDEELGKFTRELASYKEKAKCGVCDLSFVYVFGGSILKSTVLNVKIIPEGWHTHVRLERRSTGS